MNHAEWRVYRLAKAAYVAALVSPLAVPVRTVGYAISRPHHRLLYPWNEATWAIIGVGLTGLAAGLASIVVGFRCNLWRRNFAWGAVAVGILGASAGAVGVRWVDDAKTALFFNPARSASCLSNVKQVGLGLLMYAEDYDHRFPPAGSWTDSIEPYTKIKSIFQCPEVDEELPIQSYGYLRALSGADEKRLGRKESTVMIFDSGPGKNVAGALGSLAQPPRHAGGQNIGFVDGHAQTILPRSVAALIWRPTDSPPVTLERYGGMAAVGPQQEKSRSP